MAIKDYSTTPANNGTISGINIAEGCPPSGINDAIRQQMADLKSADWGAGTPKTDAIAESTSGAGVTIDGLLIKDGAVAGLVVGPASAVDGHLAAFDTATGKLIKDAGDASTVRTMLGLDTLSRRNRLCNGESLEDFRADAEVTPAASGFVSENLSLNMSQASTFKARRLRAPNIGAVKFSELLTVVSAVASPGAADYFYTRSGIEGWQDWDDMLWGTADANACTWQMWARVSVAGDYSYAVQNAARNRSYVFVKTLAAGDNYWTKTVPGDTTGTWPTSETCCTNILMDLGCGSNYETATLDAWQTGNYLRKAGTVSWISNAAATYEFGARKIENGSFPTPIGRFRDIKSWCQRYHPTIVSESTLDAIPAAIISSSTTAYVTIPFATPARTRPTGIVASGTTILTVGGPVSSAIAFNNAGTRFCTLVITSSGMTSPAVLTFMNTAGSSLRFTGAEL